MVQVVAFLFTLTDRRFVAQGQDAYAARRLLASMDAARDRPPVDGDVRFSLPILNALQHNTLWGQKANVMSGVPTDCPQRDERRGWTGDAALTAEEAVMNYAIGAVYTRWLLQYQDDQAKDGGSNNFVPALNTGDGGGVFIEPEMF